YDGVERPVAACGGGVAVPKATLYVVPTPPSDQPSVGDVPTPVAPSDGVGLVGAAGGPAGPAGVKAHAGDTRTSDAFTGVAFVRETTFHRYCVPVCSGVVGVHEYVDGGSLTS